MTRHYKTLDAMRGVAALCVLALHICKLFGLPFQPESAHLSVDFFFLLSGFVIANAYERRLVSGWPLTAFLRKRVIRLYPMILVGGALGLLVLIVRQLTARDLGWVNIALVAAPNLLLIPSPALLKFRYFGFLLNSPFWSLSAEVVVNVVYAALAPLLSRTWLAVGLVVSAFGLIALASLRSGIDVGYDWVDYPWGVVRATFPFLLGVAIYRSRERFPMGGVLNQLTVPALAAVLIIPVAGGVWFDLGLVAIVFPLLMLLGVSAPLPRGLTAVWGWLGELSYPLYAVHYPIVTAFAQFSKARRLQGSEQFLLACACAGVAIGVATTALLLFDRPVRAWLEKRFASKDGIAARAAASNQGLPV